MIKTKPFTKLEYEQLKKRALCVDDSELERLEATIKNGGFEKPDLDELASERVGYPIKPTKLIHDFLALNAELVELQKGNYLIMRYKSGDYGIYKLNWKDSRSTLTFLGAENKDTAFSLATEWILKDIGDL